MDPVREVRGTYVFGIYGFEFTRACAVDGIQLTPLYDGDEAHRIANDRRNFRLTGHAEFPVLDTHADLAQAESKSRLLADAMTFCQQQHVLVTRLIRISEGDSIERLLQPGRLARSINVAADRQTWGPAIAEDSWSPTSRCSFLSTFLARFLGAKDGDSLRLAIYRDIETHRLSNPLIELEHFLAFSGLELLARALGPDPTHGNVAVPVSGLLRQHGFDVSQVLAEEWAAARNAAFHRGEISIVRNGKTIVLSDQLYPLSTLLSDLCLKLLGFDDGHINWERWHDRQPFC